MAGEQQLNYLDELNPPQREGVVNIEGPTMLIAGAGSGKTRVLTYRIAHLMRHRLSLQNLAQTARLVDLPLV